MVSMDEHTAWRVEAGGVVVGGGRIAWCLFVNDGNGHTKQML
jgi:hypothetical protein